jgi:hypothetical protein
VAVEVAVEAAPGKEDQVVTERLTLPPLVGVVTYNPMSTLRFELLERTVRSIEKAFPTAELLLLDNGSTDGSWGAGI